MFVLRQKISFRDSVGRVQKSRMIGDVSASKEDKG